MSNNKKKTVLRRVHDFDWDLWTQIVERRMKWKAPEFFPATRLFFVADLPLSVDDGRADRSRSVPGGGNPRRSENFLVLRSSKYTKPTCKTHWKAYPETQARKASRVSRGTSRRGRRTRRGRKRGSRSRPGPWSAASTRNSLLRRRFVLLRRLRHRRRRGWRRRGGGERRRRVLVEWCGGFGG